MPDTEHNLKDSDSTIVQVLQMMLLISVIGFAGVICYLIWMVYNLIGCF